MFVVGQDVDTFVSTVYVNTLNEIWLYAGNFLNLGPFSLNQFVEKGTILEMFYLNFFQRTKKQSAGNLNCTNGDPLDPNIISDHYGPHYKYKKDQEQGHYLAGLIEGDGHFSERKLEIVLHEKDMSLAHMLKKNIGYGQIYKVKDKKAIKYVISNQEGRDKIQKLCNGKFVGPFKYNQLQKNYRLWMPLKGFLQKGEPLKKPIMNINLSTPWLSGFLDADGSLGIFIANSISHKQGKSVRQEIKISQKEDIQLKQLKDKINGSLMTDKMNISRINITGNIKIKQIIEYLDIYPLQSLKFIQYHIQRKTFRIMQRKEHQTIKGQDKIYKNKKSLSAVYKLGDPPRLICQTPLSIEDEDRVHFDKSIFHQCYYDYSIAYWN